MHPSTGIEIVVHQGAFFKQVKFTVLAQGLSRLHGQAVTSYPSESIAIGADEEINVRGTQGFG
jgi:hypothetical protein